MYDNKNKICYFYIDMFERNVFDKDYYYWRTLYFGCIEIIYG